MHNLSVNEVLNDDYDAVVNLPPANELEKTYTLEVIDKKTNTVVSILEKIAIFKVCDNISLKIRAIELDDWKRDTADIHSLTGEQKKEFINTFSEAMLVNNGAITRESLSTLIESVKKNKKTSKVRHGGHFTDNKLKKLKPNEFSPETKHKIEQPSNIVITEGIKLTPPEDRLMHAIYNSLHKKSENKDIKSPLFYAGNYDKNDGTVRLRIKKTELCKEYTGSSECSGKDMINMMSVLQKFTDKKYVIIYERKYIKNKQVLYDRVEAVQHLVKWAYIFEGVTETERTEIDTGNAQIRNQKADLIIELNSVLTDQINSKYVEYPTDINQRIAAAIGGQKRVTESMNDLRDYLLRELSAKRYKCELNKETLIVQLRLDHYTKQGRKKLVDQRIEEAIEVFKKINLITNVKIEKGKKGQTKYTFHLNQNFE